MGILDAPPRSIHGVDLGSAQLDAPQSTISGTQVDLPGLVVSVTTIGVPILVSLTGNFRNPTVGMGGFLFLYEDEYYGGGIIDTASPISPGSGSGQPVHVSMQCKRTPPPGVHTYSVKFARFGSGTFFADGAPPVGTAAQPVLLQVIQL